MYLYTNNFSKNETPSIADTRQHQMDNLLADSHPTSIANNSPRVQQLKSNQAAASASPQILQLKAYQTMADQFTSSTAQRNENTTGLPDNLKSGIENLSGYSMDDVKVHYNSPQPAQLNAHAYAQGTAIHLASGQEKHLPHEAWHVVQQKQGRVKPTLQLKGKIAINDNAGLEQEADEMGEKATRFSALPQSLTNHNTSQREVKTNTFIKHAPVQGKLVAQLRWIHHDGTNESHWESRNGVAPTQSELEALARLGRVQVPAPALTAMANPDHNPNRPHGLFLAASDAQGEIGAPFPLPLPTVPLAPIERHTDVAWLHDGQRVAHDQPRRPEITIHGGQSARELLVSLGFPDYPGAPYAHTQPDHATPVDEEREDRAMRHPSTEQANQQHTTREYAQSRVARELGPVVASRHLSGEVPGRPGVYSDMTFGTGFLTGSEVRTHRGTVPYYTHQPGRSGDEITRHRELLFFGANALASGLLDDGVLDEGDLPQAFYITSDNRSRSPERENRRRSRSRSRGRSSESSEQRSRRRRSRSRSPELNDRRSRLRSRSPEIDRRSRSNERSILPVLPSSSVLTTTATTSAVSTSLAQPLVVAAPAVIAPPAVLNLTAPNMIIHYFNIIAWANARGTYSAEFHFVRDNPNNARDLLNQAGMALGDAQTFVNNFAAQIDARHVAGGYVHADLQEQILNNLGPGEGQLLAIIRYLRRNG